MAINYIATKKVSKVNGVQISYFPTAVTESKENVRNPELASVLCQGTSMAPGDAMCLLEHLPDVIAEFLKDGRKVVIKGLGCFSVSLQADLTETPEELTPDKVTVGRMVLKADRNFNEELRNNTEFIQSK